MSSGFVAYYRVSTERQGRSGLGLDAQREAVVRHVTGHNGELIADFCEIESGKRSDRPQLAAAIGAAKKAKATLIIAKLDRLARNVHFISGLMESGVDFVAADNPHANKLMVHLLAEHLPSMSENRSASGPKMRSRRLRCAAGETGRRDRRDIALPNVKSKRGCPNARWQGFRRQKGTGGGCYNSFSQNLSGTLATIQVNPRENSPAAMTKVRIPIIVRAIVQKAAAMRRKACKLRMNMTTRIAASAIIAISTASFQPGRFPHEILKTEAICDHDQTHSVSIVRITQVSP
jgi:hypothetical protein